METECTRNHPGPLISPCWCSSLSWKVSQNRSSIYHTTRLSNQKLWRHKINIVVSLQTTREVWPFLLSESTYFDVSWFFLCIPNFNTHISILTDANTFKVLSMFVLYNYFLLFLTSPFQYPTLVVLLLTFHTKRSYVSYEQSFS